MSSSDELDTDVESGSDIRAHHNAQERSRREVIKQCFDDLRDVLPCFQPGQKVSREQIMRKATEYNIETRRRISEHKRDIVEIRRDTEVLKDEVRALKKAIATGDLAPVAAIIEQSKKENSKVAHGNPETESEDSSDDSDDWEDRPRRKKSKNKF